jgi:hypothetical protein
MARLIGKIDYRPSRERLLWRIRVFMAEAQNATESDFEQWFSMVPERDGIEASKPRSSTARALRAWSKEDQ